MAWTDAPTEKQLGAYRIIVNNVVPWDVAIEMLRILEKKTRKDVSEELQRVKDLYDGHRLDVEAALDPDFYNGIEYKHATPAEREDW